MTATDPSMTTIAVGGPAPYDVLVGPGAASRVAAVLPGVSSVAVVHDERLSGPAAPVVASLEASGARVQVLTVPSGEQAKSVDVLARLWDQFAAVGIGRQDAVVAVGGGATTDVAGFAAATWLRGVRVVHVPTTLLAMVDAAIGGKTGINTGAGKNLVGAFHPPAGVVVDLDVLATLPADEWVNGMAEVVKAGFIADPAILDLVEADLDGAARPDGPHTRDLVERSIAVKAGVVARDLRESGPREIRNYGHTLGHAIELVEDFRWPHGHAVGVGMVFAAALGRAVAGLDDDTADRHRRILDRLGLPTRYRSDAWPQLSTAMRRDKKARAGQVRFVVLEGLARPLVVDAPARAVLASVYAEVSAGQ